MAMRYQFSQSTNRKIRVATSVLQFIGILLTLFRLCFRLRIQRFWWEDAWAMVACVGAIILLISEWMYLDGVWLVSLVGFWIYSFSWMWVIWAVRMSILFSIARIVHLSERMRHSVTAFAVFFSLVFLAFAALHLWWYTRDATWSTKPAFYTLPATRLPRSVHIYELATDCVSNVILVSFPVPLLWSMKLPTNQRRMLISIFSTSIVIMMASIFRGVSQMANLTSLVGMAVDVEVASATIICNLLVIVTLIYRFSRGGSSSTVSEFNPQDDDFTTRATARTTPALTTVQFSSLAYTGSGSEECPNVSSQGTDPGS